MKASSQLQTLRASVPANPFSLIARARGDLDRLQTVLESYGYYQGKVTITIDGLKLDDAALGERLSALPPERMPAAAQVSSWALSTISGRSRSPAASLQVRAKPWRSPLAPLRWRARCSPAVHDC